MFVTYCVIFTAAVCGVVMADGDGSGKYSAIDSGVTLMVCSLSEDLSKVKRNLVVDRVSDSQKETVLRCGFNGKPDPICMSSFGFELVGNLTDHLVANVPPEKVQRESSYMCHVLSSNQREPTVCQLITVPRQCHDPGNPPSTDIPVQQTTTVQRAASTAHTDDRRQCNPPSTAIPVQQTTTVQRQCEETCSTLQLQTRMDTLIILDVFVLVTVLFLPLLVTMIIIRRLSVSRKSWRSNICRDWFCTQSNKRPQSVTSQSVTSHSATCSSPMMLEEPKQNTTENGHHFVPREEVKDTREQGRPLMNKENPYNVNVRLQMPT